MRRTLAIISALLLAAPAMADDSEPPSSRYSTGLSVFANAGGFWADKATAGFYDGRPTNANTINRILHSSQYGPQIWNDLVNAGRISPSAIGSYEQLSIVEYPMEMYYKTSYQVGLGIKYGYASGFGWLLRFDIAKLQAAGVFNLSTANGASVPGTDQYIPCDIMGKENRISIDLAVTRSFMLTDNVDLELDLGFSLVNAKVQDNLIRIEGRTYSILDRWNGQTPDVGTVGSPYINQGGIGYGGFSSLLIGYKVNGIGALKAGYTCNHSKIVLQGHTAWGWHHMIGIRVEMNNFKI